MRYIIFLMAISSVFYLICLPCCSPTSHDSDNDDERESRVSMPEIFRLLPRGDYTTAVGYRINELLNSDIFTQLSSNYTSVHSQLEYMEEFIDELNINPTYSVQFINIYGDPLNFSERIFSIIAPIKRGDYQYYFENNSPSSNLRELQRENISYWITEDNIYGFMMYDEGVINASKNTLEYIIDVITGNRSAFIEENHFRTVLQLADFEATLFSIIWGGLENKLNGIKYSINSILNDEQLLSAIDHLRAFIVLVYCRSDIEFSFKLLFDNSDHANSAYDALIDHIEPLLERYGSRLISNFLFGLKYNINNYRELAERVQINLNEETIEIEFWLNWNDLENNLSDNEEVIILTCVESIACAPDGTLYVTIGYDRKILHLTENGELINMWEIEGVDEEGISDLGGIAIGSNGTLFVSDRDNHKIIQFDEYGNIQNEWGNEGRGRGQFSHPIGITVTEDGLVYVVDSMNNRIQVFNENGQFVKEWNVGIERRRREMLTPRPFDIAIAPDNTIYITYLWENIVRHYSETGNQLNEWSYGSDYEYDSPSTNIEINQNGEIFLIDTENNRILIYDLGGRFLRRWGDELEDEGSFYPKDVTFLSDGTFYIAESFKICHFDNNGNLIRSWKDSRGSIW